MKFGATDTVFEGFRITRQKPVLLLWLGLVNAVIFALTVGLAYQPFVQVMEMAGTLQGGQQPTEEDFTRLVGLYGNLLTVALPLSLIGSSIVLPAVVRATLTPEDSRFGYLRLGRDEFHTFIVLLVLSLGWFALIAISGAVVGLASMAGVAVAVLVGIFAFLGVSVLAIWLGIRLSLAVPITVAEKRIAIVDSFKLTKGHFWPILGMALLVFVLSFGVQLLVNIVASPFSMMSGGGFGLLTGQGVTVATVVGFAGVVASSVLMSAAQALILYAPFAAAYRVIRNS